MLRSIAFTILKYDFTFSGTYKFMGNNNVKPYYQHTDRQIILHSSTTNNYWQLGPSLNGGAYAYRNGT